MMTDGTRRLSAAQMLAPDALLSNTLILIPGHSSGGQGYPGQGLEQVGQDLLPHHQLQPHRGPYGEAGRGGAQLPGRPSTLPPQSQGLHTTIELQTKVGEDVTITG